MTYILIYIIDPIDSIDLRVHPSPAIPTTKGLVEKVFNGEGQGVQRQGLQSDIHLLGEKIKPEALVTRFFAKKHIPILYHHSSIWIMDLWYKPPYFIYDPKLVKSCSITQLWIMGEPRQPSAAPRAVGSPRGCRATPSDRPRREGEGPVRPTGPGMWVPF